MWWGALLHEVTQNPRLMKLEPYILIPTFGAGVTFESQFLCQTTRRGKEAGGEKGEGKTPQALSARPENGAQHSGENPTAMSDCKRDSKMRCSWMPGKK
jgi:hypothetical protein